MISGERFDKKYFTSGAYKDYKKILAGWVKPTARRISNWLKGKSSPKVLDIGCGFGDLIAELQDRYNFSVAGIEISSFAIKKARSSIQQKIKKGSILKLPFKKNSFDAVICFDTIYYVGPEETAKAVKNLIHVSRDYIFFNSIYRNSIYASQKQNPDPLRVTVLSKKEYVNLFKKGGARIVGRFLEENGGETLVFRKSKR